MIRSLGPVIQGHDLERLPIQLTRLQYGINLPLRRDHRNRRQFHKLQSSAPLLTPKSH